MFSWFTNNTRRVHTDEQKIQNLLTRGVEQIYPNSEFLKERLQSGEQLTIYLGIDPTGPTLHLGHAIPLRKLREFQELGHKVILLIGDFTARIGDPDKKEVRKQLTHAQVMENARLYKEQASTFLRFTGTNAAELRFNNSWLGKLTFSDVIELASKMTVQQMLERDMFRKRISEEKPIYIHEFLYPLMQGYDSIAMDVDGEVGGNDQTFNMLAGRTLMKEQAGKEKFVLPTKLLVDPTGAKMGKTTGNMLSFIDTPEEKFGKVMSWTDDMLELGFELCTDVPLTEVQQRLTGGENPRDIKMDLATEVVATYHGSEIAQKAKDNFIRAFQKGGVPDEIPEVSASAGTPSINVFVGNDVVSSKTEFRRLVTSGAVTNKTTEETLTDPDTPIAAGTYKIGKHRFYKVVVHE